MGATRQAATSDEMRVIGKRLRWVRRMRNVSQSDLARRIGTSPSQISVIESNKSGTSLKSAIAIADALYTSLDFLTGRVDDPRTASEMVEKLRDQDQALFEGKAGLATREPNAWRDYVAISEIDTAAGSGAVVHDERITGRIKFPTLWLYREGLNPTECRIIRVIGESMEPTLPDGCSILVNREQRQRRHGRIFVIRVGNDELIVKRTLKNPDAGWLIASDNPDRNAWPTQKWPPEGEPVGEVRWVWHSLP